MTPEDLEHLLSTSRAQPPRSLRDRVLAALSAYEPPSPWWARMRTWGIAAGILFAIDIAQDPTLWSAVQSPQHLSASELSILADPDLAWASPLQRTPGTAPTSLIDQEDWTP